MIDLRGIALATVVGVWVTRVCTILMLFQAGQAVVVGADGLVRLFGDRCHCLAHEHPGCHRHPCRGDFA